MIPRPYTCLLLLLCSATWINNCLGKVELSSTSSDECTELIDSKGCSLGLADAAASAPCSDFIQQCLSSTSFSNSKCCAPAFVSYNYVAAGLTVESSDLIDLEQCTLNASCLADSASCSSSMLVQYTVSESKQPCTNQQALPQLLSGPSCAKGFLCEFDIDLCNMGTWPQYCSPDTSCSVDLLQYQYCSPQNDYEPKVCQPGKYCSRKSSYEAKSESKNCPSGKYCIMGTEKPIDCGSLSHCGNKSEHPVQFSCMVVMILFDILLYIYLEQRQNKVIAAQKIVSGHQGKAKFQVLPPGLETNSDNPIQAPLLVTEGGPVGSIFSDAAAITASPNVDEQTGITSNSSTYQLVRGFTRARGRIFSLDFEFERLGLVLPNGNAILQSVSARVKPGCVTAIMGPSGAGKTTLLNTLMGKQSPTFKQTGTLKINGKIRNIKDFRSVVGFVPQEDIMIRELSVRDNIEYSARIRLPPSWSDVDITEHVDAVLDVLSLAHVQHTRIGDEKTRGVSGGQRKRVNIGIEVAACPVALYLDEPTSGLDATAALAVTDALKEIAHTTGITVAMVIHQPRYEIWEALDEVLFLAPGGRTVFLGNLQEVQGYFQSKMGFYPKERDNPADFYMDRIAESADRCVEVWQQHAANSARANEATNSTADGHTPSTEAALRQSHSSGSDSRASTYIRRSTIGTGVRSKLHNFADEARDVSEADLAEVLAECGVFGDIRTQAKLLMEAYDKSQTGFLSATELDDLLYQIESDKRGASFFKQAIMAHNRSLKQQLNRPVSLLIELGTVSFAGALMGFASKNPYTGILVAPYTIISPANQVVLVPMTAMFAGMAVGLAAAPTGVHAFGSELVVYWREASVGHSKGAYYIGKSFSNSYRMLVGALHFCAWYLLLAETILTSFQLYSIVLMLFFAVYGMSCVVSMVLPIDTANLVAVVVALLVPVFGGFVRNLKQWIKYSTYSWWANEAFFSYAITPYEDIFLVDKTAHVWSYTLDETTKDLLMVLMIGVIYRVIAFICMTQLNKEKQS